MIVISNVSYYSSQISTCHRKGPSQHMANLVQVPLLLVQPQTIECEKSYIVVINFQCITLLLKLHTF